MTAPPTTTVRALLSPGVEGWRLIHADADAGNLRFARVAVFGLWALYFATSPFQHVAELPLGLMQPVLALQVLPAGVRAALHDAPALLAIRIALVGLAVACAARRSALVWLGLPFAVLATGVQGYLRSWGSVSHGEIAPLLSAWLLWAGAAIDRAGGRGRVEARAPLITICFLITFTYALVGVHRLASDPIVLFDDSMTAWAITSAHKDNALPGGLGYLAAESALVRLALTGGFVATTLVEVLSPLALFHRRFRYLWVAYMALFHLGTLVVMRILFWENLVLYLLFFESLRLAPRPRAAGLG